MFLCPIAYLLKNSCQKSNDHSIYIYFADSVHWRYIIDRFVIDVYLKTIVAKKKKCAHFSEMQYRFYAFKNNAAPQLIFY